MNKTIAATAILLALGLTACNDAPKTNAVPSPSTAEQAKHSQLTQAQLQQFGDSLGVSYRVLTNRPDDNCDKAAAEGRCFVAEIDFVPEVELNSRDWAIYFSQMRPVQAVESKEFSITHIKGDLYRIAPTEAFSGFSKGEKKTLRFRGELWQLSETDAMPNY